MERLEIGARLTKGLPIKSALSALPNNLRWRVIADQALSISEGRLVGDLAVEVMTTLTDDSGKDYHTTTDTGLRFSVDVDISNFQQWEKTLTSHLEEQSASITGQGKAFQNYLRSMGLKALVQGENITFTLREGFILNAWGQCLQYSPALAPSRKSDCTLISNSDQLENHLTDLVREKINERIKNLSSPLLASIKEDLNQLSAELEDRDIFINDKEAVVTLDLSQVAAEFLGSYIKITVTSSLAVSVEENIDTKLAAYQFVRKFPFISIIKVIDDSTLKIAVTPNNQRLFTATIRVIDDSIQITPDEHKETTLAEGVILKKIKSINHTNDTLRFNANVILPMWGKPADVAIQVEGGSSKLILPRSLNTKVFLGFEKTLVIKGIIKGDITITSMVISRKGIEVDYNYGASVDSRLKETIESRLKRIDANWNHQVVDLKEQIKDLALGSQESAFLSHLVDPSLVSAADLGPLNADGELIVNSYGISYRCKNRDDAKGVFDECAIELSMPLPDSAANCKKLYKGIIAWDDSAGKYILGNITGGFVGYQCLEDQIKLLMPVAHNIDFERTITPIVNDKHIILEQAVEIEVTEFLIHDDLKLSYIFDHQGNVDIEIIENEQTTISIEQYMVDMVEAAGRHNGCQVLANLSSSSDPCGIGNKTRTLTEYNTEVAVPEQAITKLTTERAERLIRENFGEFFTNKDIEYEIETQRKGALEIPYAVKFPIYIGNGGAIRDLRFILPKKLDLSSISVDAGVTAALNEKIDTLFEGTDVKTSVTRIYAQANDIYVDIDIEMMLTGLLSAPVKVAIKQPLKQLENISVQSDIKRQFQAEVLSRLAILTNDILKNIDLGQDGLIQLPDNPVSVSKGTSLAITASIVISEEFKLTSELMLTIPVFEEGKVKISTSNPEEVFANSALKQLAGFALGELGLGDLSILSIDESSLELVCAEGRAEECLGKIPTGVTFALYGNLIEVIQLRLPDVILDKRGVRVDQFRGVGLKVPAGIVLAPLPVAITQVKGNLTTEELELSARLTLGEVTSAPASAMLFKMVGTFRLQYANSIVIETQTKNVLLSFINLGTTYSGLNLNEGLIETSIDLTGDLSDIISVKGNGAIKLKSPAYIQGQLSAAVLKLEAVSGRFYLNLDTGRIEFDGKIDLIIFKEQTSFKTDDGLRNPSLSSSTNLKIGKFRLAGTEMVVDPNAAELNFSVLGIDMGIVTPNVFAMSKDEILKMILRLLSPDLENLDEALKQLLKGNIKINPMSSFGPGDGGVSGVGGDSKGGNGGGNGANSKGAEGENSDGNGQDQGQANNSDGSGHDKRSGTMIDLNQTAQFARELAEQRAKKNKPGEAKETPDGAPTLEEGSPGVLMPPGEFAFKVVPLNDDYGNSVQTKTGTESGIAHARVKLLPGQFNCDGEICVSKGTPLIYWPNHYTHVINENDNEAALYWHRTMVNLETGTRLDKQRGDDAIVGRFDLNSLFDGNYWSQYKGSSKRRLELTSVFIQGSGQWVEEKQFHFIEQAQWLTATDESFEAISALYTKSPTAVWYLTDKDGSEVRIRYVKDFELVDLAKDAKFLDSVLTKLWDDEARTATIFKINEKLYVRIKDKVSKWDEEKESLDEHEDPVLPPKFVSPEVIEAEKARVKEEERRQKMREKSKEFEDSVLTPSKGSDTPDQTPQPGSDNYQLFREKGTGTVEWRANSPLTLYYQSHDDLTGEFKKPVITLGETKDDKYWVDGTPHFQRKEGEIWGSGPEMIEVFSHNSSTYIQVAQYPTTCKSKVFFYRSNGIGYIDLSPLDLCEGELFIDLAPDRAGIFKQLVKHAGNFVRYSCDLHSSHELIEDSHTHWSDTGRSYVWIDYIGPDNISLIHSKTKNNNARTHQITGDLSIAYANTNNINIESLISIAIDQGEYKIDSFNVNNGLYVKIGSALYLWQDGNWMQRGNLRLPPNQFGVLQAKFHEATLKFLTNKWNSLNEQSEIVVFSNNNDRVLFEVRQKGNLPSELLEMSLGEAQRKHIDALVSKIGIPDCDKFTTIFIEGSTVDLPDDFDLNNKKISIERKLVTPNMLCQCINKGLGTLFIDRNRSLKITKVGRHPSVPYNFELIRAQFQDGSFDLTVYQNEYVIDTTPLGVFPSFQPIESETDAIFAYIDQFESPNRPVIANLSSAIFLFSNQGLWRYNSYSKTYDKVSSQDITTYRKFIPPILSYLAKQYADRISELQLFPIGSDNIQGMAITLGNDALLLSSETGDTSLHSTEVKGYGKLHSDTAKAALLRYVWSDEIYSVSVTQSNSGQSLLLEHDKTTSILLTDNESPITLLNNHVIHQDHLKACFISGIEKRIDDNRSIVIDRSNVRTIHADVDLMVIQYLPEEGELEGNTIQIFSAVPDTMNCYQTITGLQHHYLHDKVIANIFTAFRNDQVKEVEVKPAAGEVIRFEYTKDNLTSYYLIKGENLVQGTIEAHDNIQRVTNAVATDMENGYFGIPDFPYIHVIEESAEISYLAYLNQKGDREFHYVVVALTGSEFIHRITIDTPLTLDTHFLYQLSKNNIHKLNSNELVKGERGRFGIARKDDAIIFDGQVLHRTVFTKPINNPELRLALVRDVIAQTSETNLANALSELKVDNPANVAMWQLDSDRGRVVRQSGEDTSVYSVNHFRSPSSLPALSQYISRHPNDLSTASIDYVMTDILHDNNRVICIADESTQVIFDDVGAATPVLRSLFENLPIQCDHRHLRIHHLERWLVVKSESGWGLWNCTENCQLVSQIRTQTDLTRDASQRLIVFFQSLSADIQRATKAMEYLSLAESDYVIINNEIYRISHDANIKSIGKISALFSNRLESTALENFLNGLPDDVTLKDELQSIDTPRGKAATASLEADLYTVCFDDRCESDKIYFGPNISYFDPELFAQVVKEHFNVGGLGRYKLIDINREKIHFFVTSQGIKRYYDKQFLFIENTQGISNPKQWAEALFAEPFLRFISNKGEMSPKGLITKLFSHASHFNLKGVIAQPLASSNWLLFSEVRPEPFQAYLSLQSDKDLLATEVTKRNPTQEWIAQYKIGSRYYYVIDNHIINPQNILHDAAVFQQNWTTLEKLISWLDKGNSYCDIHSPESGVYLIYASCAKRVLSHALLNATSAVVALPTADNDTILKDNVKKIARYSDAQNILFTMLHSIPCSTKANSASVLFDKNYMPYIITSGSIAAKNYARSSHISTWLQERKDSFGIINAYTCSLIDMGNRGQKIADFQGSFIFQSQGRYYLGSKSIYLFYGQASLDERVIRIKELTIDNNLNVENWTKNKILNYAGESVSHQKNNGFPNEFFRCQGACENEIDHIQ
jgi:hypothetical protein